MLAMLMGEERRGERRRRGKKENVLVCFTKRWGRSYDALVE